VSARLHTDYDDVGLGVLRELLDLEFGGSAKKMAWIGSIGPGRRTSSKLQILLWLACEYGRIANSCDGGAT